MTSAEFLPRLVLVCASRCEPQWFDQATLLGRSLQQFPENLRPEAYLLLNNQGPGLTGLAEFYNQAIDAIEGDALVAFVHDDVYIHDWNLRFTLAQALCFWDVVGVVGAARVPHGQPSWSYELGADGEVSLSTGVVRSGSINHFDPAHVRPSYYGEYPMQCDLLDGVFMAADLKRLRQKKVRFDSCFRFHCYDADFCYTARAQGLTLGTWPLLLTHASPGSWSQPWLAAARQLQAKLRNGNQA
jgi:hypothetical protein